MLYPLIPFLTLLCYGTLFSQIPPQEPDPFQIPADTLQKRGIRSITLSPTTPRPAASPFPAEGHFVERAEYNRRGHQLRRSRLEYGRYGVEGGWEESRRFRHDDEQLVEENREVYDISGIVGCRYSYEGAQLVEEKSESLADGKRWTFYEYDAEGRLAKVSFGIRNPRVETYHYEGLRLVRQDFFDLEENEEPDYRTFYRYDERDTLREVLEITSRKGDTTVWKKYNPKGKIHYLRKRSYSSASLNWSDRRKPFWYEAFYTYDAQGRRQSVRFTPPEYAHSPLPDSLRFATIDYHYDGELLQRVDSFYLRQRYQRDAQGRIERIVHTMIPSGDTAFVDHYSYDRAQRLSSIYRRDYVQLLHNRLNRAYDEEGRLIAESEYRFFIQSRCRQVHESEPRGGRITQYCDVNPRRLPADVPYERREYVLNAQRDTIYLQRSHGDPDGSIRLADQDTLVYRAGRLHYRDRLAKSLGWDRAVRQGLDYDAAGQLRTISESYLKGDGRDTLRRRELVYEAGALVQMLVWQRDKKEWEIHYDDARRIRRRLLYDRQGAAVQREWSYRYDPRGLLIEVTQADLESGDKKLEVLRYQYDYW
ncbi:MAG: hypothetical protein AAFW73_00375 [Bacteroidota bacterium]